MPKAKPTQYKQPSLVSGLSVNEIINMDIATFNSYNLKDMQKIVGRLVSAGNKRVRRMEQAGLKSTPVTKLMESGGMLSTKGKNLNQLRSEFMRAKNFLEDSRSSVAGQRKFRKEVIDKLAKDHNVKISVSQFDNFFEVYEKLKELRPETDIIKAIKYGLFGVIAEETREVDENGKPKEINVDEIVNRLAKQIDSIYEKNEARRQEDERMRGTSDYIDI